MEKQTERTIYFKDLLFAALYKWKWILPVAMICGVLLGGMELLSSNDTVTLNTTSITPENQIKIDQLTVTLEQTEAQIENHTAYLKDSVLMSLDSYAAYTAGIYVFPKPASLENIPAGATPYDNTSRILRAYSSHLTSTATMQTIGAAYDMEGRYMAELITFDSSVSGCLGITVRGRNADEAQSIADALLQAMEAQTESVNQSIEAHTLTVIPFYAGPKVDTALYNTQNTAQQKLTTLKNTLTTTTTELNKLLPTQLVVGESKPLLFAMVGAVLGACLVIGIAWIGHIGSGKVYSARVLKDRTGIRILGCINGRKRNPIDSWLRKLEGRASYDQLDAVTVNIRNHCENVKNLLILGYYPENTINVLTETLAKDGIVCTLCGDPARSAQALEALPGCDAVVLVETCGASRFDSVEWEMETVADHNKPLLGCILIDG